MSSTTQTSSIAKTLVKGLEDLAACQKGEHVKEEGAVLPKKEPFLTTATGCPVGQVKNSLSAGPHGPLVLQDIFLLEKLQHFDRERIPQRNVHALGVGCYGNLKITHDISQFSCAKVFSKVGATIPLFTRFSGIFTEQGDAETTRDPRGFALKFYTEEGNWDLLAINTPVFNVRDPKMGPDAIHAFKRDPRTHEWNPNQVWDFVCQHPEALHQTLMIFSDRGGTPLSYRHMHAYGCNTFSFINADRKRIWVKFHLISKQGAHGLQQHEAKILAGEDPDWLSRDLREAITRGRFPQWTLSFQYMTEEAGYQNPITFDCTKSWPHSDFPLHEIGIITLDDLPRDYHAEVEQVAFSPANIIPGIGFSPDKLLQGRLFIYDDTQFHRLGTNYKQIPINLPNMATVHTQYVGGQHQGEVYSKWPHYSGSNFPHTVPADKKYQEIPTLSDGSVNYYDYPERDSDKDFYAQPREFFTEVLSEKKEAHLCLNIAISLSKVSEKKIVGDVLEHLRKIDASMEKGVRMEIDRISKGEGLDIGQKLWKELREKLLMETP